MHSKCFARQYNNTILISTYICGNENGIVVLSRYIYLNFSKVSSKSIFLEFKITELHENSTRVKFDDDEIIFRYYQYSNVHTYVHTSVVCQIQYTCSRNLLSSCNDSLINIFCQLDWNSKKILEVSNSREISRVLSVNVCPTKFEICVSPQKSSLYAGSEASRKKLQCTVYNKRVSLSRSDSASKLPRSNDFPLRCWTQAEISTVRDSKTY